MTAWDLAAAKDYVLYHAIDNEDYLDGDEIMQTRLLNVASRTLTRKYSKHVIPDEAVYLFAATLAAAFNDVNKMAQQGIASFSVRGIAFTFKDWAKKGLDDLIPDEVTDLIGVPSGRQVRRTTL